MDLTITDPEAERLARELAEATGESIDAAVVSALRERLERQKPPEEDEIARRTARAWAIALEFGKLPILDDRNPDEILGYDENGLPT